VYTHTYPRTERGIFGFEPRGRDETNEGPKPENSHGLNLSMMMIAFTTINSGLVPLIEGLYAQILNFEFDIIGGLRSHLLLFFFRRKIC